MTGLLNEYEKISTHWVLFPTCSADLASARSGERGLQLAGYDVIDTRDGVNARWQ
jgi:hypothetical protein